ncbi:hypothetical protein GQV48_003333 [Salmonella enterica subsp. enterica serovar Cerro]|nr:hypothetical protein [Salmonella enterica subsp. enterica serovar Cerro]
MGYLAPSGNGRLDVQMNGFSCKSMQMTIIIICGSSRQGGLPRGGACADNG